MGLGHLFLFFFFLNFIYSFACFFHWCFYVSHAFIFRAVYRTPVYKWRYSPSSSPQDPVFTTNGPPPVIEAASNPLVETNTGLPVVAFNPISDSNALSEAGSVDMDRFDLGLSLPLQPSSLDGGSSLPTALGMPFPFLFQMIRPLNGPCSFIFFCSASTPDLQPPFFN